MKKLLLLLSLCLALMCLGGQVSAAEKVLKEPMIAFGEDLSQEQLEETRQLLGGGSLSQKQEIKVTKEMLAKYLDGGNLAIISSVYIQPLSKGSGVQVEIVTPDKISKVSSATYKNAAITLGAQDVLIRIATVSQATGEGALAGIFAILEQTGVKLDKETVTASQDEVGIIQDLRDQTTLSDADANQWLGKLKKTVGKKVLKKAGLDRASLEKILRKAIKDAGLELDANLLERILTWLEAYAQLDAAKSKGTEQQIETSVMQDDWYRVLGGLESGYSRKKLLKLKKKDYATSKGYAAIIKPLYDYLLQMIEQDDRDGVYLVYSHSFVLEKIQTDLTSKDREALNYIRSLVYYYLAGKEDQQLAKDGKDSTKKQLLTLLDRYNELNQTPTLKDILNRIAIATGQSLEAYTYLDLTQEGDLLSLTIQGKDKVSVAFNLKTGKCSYMVGKKEYKDSIYNFKTLYKVAVQTDYRPVVDTIKGYQLTENDLSLLSGEQLQLAQRLAYAQVLKEYYDKFQDPNFTFSAEMEGVDEFAALADYKNYQSNTPIGYTFYDINGDGVEELLIGGGEVIFAVYTFDGKQAVNLLSGQGVHIGYRSYLKIFQDGSLVNWGSGGANRHGVNLYTIKSDRTGLNKGLNYYVEGAHSEYGTNKEIPTQFIIGDYQTGEKLSEADFMARYGDEFKKYDQLTDNPLQVQFNLSTLTQEALDALFDRNRLELTTSQEAEVREILQTYGQGRVLLHFMIKDKNFLQDSQVATYSPDDKQANGMTYLISGLDMRDVVDYYNTAFPEVYDNQAVFEQLENQFGGSFLKVEQVDQELKSLSEEDIIALFKQSTDRFYIYFKKDNQLAVRWVPDGAFPSWEPADKSEWVLSKEELVIPVRYAGNDKVVAKVHLKPNKKDYKGGRKKSSYYISQVEMMN